jgi:hypothetical protein
LLVFPQLLHAPSNCLPVHLDDLLPLLGRESAVEYLAQVKLQRLGVKCIVSPVQ